MFTNKYAVYKKYLHLSLKLSFIYLTHPINYSVIIQPQHKRRKGLKIMKHNKILCVALLLTITAIISTVFASCTGTNNSKGSTSDTSKNGSNTVTENENISEFIATMKFNNTSCDISDTSAITVDGKYYTITKAGTYEISGTLDDGQIIVNVAKTERVTLLLDNFTGSCSDSAVIYIKSADKAYIDLKKDSNNTLTDSSLYTFADPAETKPNACIYSSDDLVIKGGGTLTVNAKYNNGIGCKNDIEIKNGHVYINAVNNAIKGNDSVTVCGDAEVTVTAADDAIKSDCIDKDNKGFILITDEAKVTVTCTDDALQAPQSVKITVGATLTVVSASSAVNCDGVTDVGEGCIILK